MMINDISLESILQKSLNSHEMIANRITTKMLNNSNHQPTQSQSNSIYTIKYQKYEITEAPITQFSQRQF